MSGNRKGKHDVSPIVRGAFLEALKRIKREDGKTFSEIIANWLREDPGAVLNAVSKFTVRESNLTADIKTSLVNVLAGIAEGERADSELEGESDSLRH